MVWTGGCLLDVRVVDDDDVDDEDASSARDAAAGSLWTEDDVRIDGDEGTEDDDMTSSIIWQRSASS